MKHNTTGHSQTHGGLRGHSIGSFYPYHVYYQGLLDNPLGWCITHTLDPEFEDVKGLTVKHACNLAQAYYNCDAGIWEKIT